LEIKYGRPIGKLYEILAAKLLLIKPIRKFENLGGKSRQPIKKFKAV